MGFLAVDAIIGAAPIEGDLLSVFSMKPPLMLAKPTESGVNPPKMAAVCEMAGDKVEVVR